MLLIYNICELKHWNLFWYVECLDNIIDQNYDNFNIVISGCGVTMATKKALMKRYGSRIWYNWMDDPLIIPITFNKTVTEVVNRVGEFDGYVYIDSGINPKNEKNCLTEINSRARMDKYGIISLQANDDMGYDWWFGFPKDTILTGKDFIVPVGKCINLHFQYYDKLLYQYYGRLIPDIFAAYCLETVYTFITLGVNKQWVIVKDLFVHHGKGIDGSGVAVPDHIGPKGAGNNLYGNLDIRDIVYNDESKEVGFGYNEAGTVLGQFYHMHDSEKFTAEGLSKNPDRLAKFCKDKLFLKKEMFDYDTVKFDLTI